MSLRAIVGKAAWLANQENAGHVAIPVEHAGEEVVVTDAPKRPDFGRKGSVIAQKYATGAWTRKATKTPAPDDKVLTNEEVVRAVHAKVQDAVNLSSRYYHVFGYTLLVAAYLLVLHIQARVFDSADVVTSLRNALSPGGKHAVRFRDNDEVLSYIGNTAILPIWEDPVCGDSKCEWPWEFPSFGRFGCRADCGVESNTTKVMVNVRANFAQHKTLSPSILMGSAAWNLCLEDENRRKRGEADICWFEEDVRFDEIVVNKLETMELIDGIWYIKVTGDYAGVISGRVFDISRSTDPVTIDLEPKWEDCLSTTSRQEVSSTDGGVRRLLSTWAAAYKEDTFSNEELNDLLIQELKKEIDRIQESSKN